MQHANSFSSEGDEAAWEESNHSDPEGKIPAWPHLPNFTLTERFIDRLSAQSPGRRSESPLFEPMVERVDTTEELMSEAASEPESPPATPSRPDNILARVRTTKIQINQTLKIIGSKPMHPRARNVIDDPENQAIKRMRQDEQMGWEAIAEHLNKERLERGEPQTYTAAAVYSRFVRNAPRIAAAQGEVGFTPRDCKRLFRRLLCG